MYSPILIELTSYVFVIPLIVLLVRFKRLTEVQKWISLMIAVAGLSSLTALELANRGIYNTPVLHTYVVLELSVYTWIFHKSMPDRFGSKKAWVIIAGFTLLSLLNSAFLQPLMEFNSNARSLESFVLIILSITYFYHLFQKMEVYDLQKLPTFWVAAGVLIDFSVNLLYFSFMDWLVYNHLEVFRVAEFIHSIANIILYLLLAIALSVNPAKAKMN